MAKVAATARANFRAALLSADVPSSIADRQLDVLIRSVRATLNSSNTNGLDEEADCMSRALDPVRELLLENREAAAWDSDVWSGVLWDIYTAMVSSTMAATKCANLTADEEAWSDMVTVLLARPTAAEAIAIHPWWGRRWTLVLALFGIGLAMAYLAMVASSLELSGRSKFWLLCAASVALLCADAWRRWGWNLSTISVPAPRKQISFGTRNEEAPSSASGSSKLRAEKEVLELRIKLLEQQGAAAPGLQPIPEGAPPLPAPPGLPPGLVQQSELMGSLQGMAGGTAHSGHFSSTPGVVHSGLPGSSADQVVFEVGDIIELRNMLKQRELNGKRGIISEVADGSRFHVILSTGASLKFLHRSFFSLGVLQESDTDYAPLIEITARIWPALHDDAGGEAPQDGAEVYAPLAVSELSKNMTQAKAIKDLLLLWHARAATMPNWIRQFWRGVHSLSPFTPLLKAVLQNQGYLGPSTISMPRVTELRDRLSEIEASGLPAHGSAAQFLAQESSLIDNDDDDMANWHNKLPLDLKRAAPEIFQRCKASGVQNVREWVNQWFPIDKRGDPRYLELFNGAAFVDFEVAKCPNAQAVMMMLGSADGCEIALRRMAAYVHERRTGDIDSANAMLAIRPAGNSCDIAPHWLVTESSFYSQSEHKRRERARAQGGGAKGATRDHKGKADGKGKEPGGRGRGRGGKGRGDGGGAAPSPPHG